MILGLGVDICPVERITKVLARHGEAFSKRVFTEGELEYAGDCKVTSERLAARWAAKEAAIKALAAPEGLAWTDMEITRSSDGAPALILRGRAKERADELKVSRIFVSLTHAGGIAAAVVILEGDL